MAQLGAITDDSAGSLYADCRGSDDKDIHLFE
jgi:hypothetical protein